MCVIKFWVISVNCDNGNPLPWHEFFLSVNGRIARSYSNSIGFPTERLATKYMEFQKTKPRFALSEMEVIETIMKYSDDLQEAIMRNGVRADIKSKKMPNKRCN